ncbi:acyl-CoA dehydrogenase family protein [Micromonospora sp. WMMD882]|uniref:acyl-CoA dehydrogenase family protein n=1 Tax=Micromonospora sp. WMMD882 TaxID=3015151 RepID=UPI00248C6702|nr:acyl-CoA dehydrogenase family protein [Micromonospora sp. WMMD882]WBB81893.1 acyl-CoA dehydrogenase family protein [Micromonospora sp. WMMD882]
MPHVALTDHSAAAPQRRADEVHALLDLASELADKELAPRADDFEARAEFPRAVLRTLGRAGLLSLPYPVDYGGGGQSYETYLAVLEILARRWLCVAQSVNIHVLSCYGLAHHGSPEQRERLLPEMLGGDLLGANCVSEPEAGSDVSAIACRATREDGHWTVTGTKAWTSHAGQADFYNVFCRTGGPGVRGLSLLLADARLAGLHVQRPERKMGVRSSPTATVVFDGARVPADRMIGRPGKGFLIATGLFDRGRLGIAACAVGLATAALEHALAYARSRQQFGQPVAEFQGVSFLLADISTQLAAARALVREAARALDAGADPNHVTAMAARAKLFATDTAMRATTDAVQILGGYGYVQDHPVERWMREAKLLQLIEGTNQIQRVVIARNL